MTAPLASEPALAVKDLTVRRGGRTVLDGVSFAVEAGGFTGLIGANGAGKTTLLRAILGLVPVSRGRVRVPRGSVGYVPQRLVLDPDLPVRARDLIALGLDGHRLGLPLPSHTRRRRVQEMLEAVQAEPFADRRVGLLSGGELQRVLIGHALIGRPQVLLLDEPRVAVLISAHEMNPLLPVIDRIVYLAGGRAAAGPVEEVVRSEVLSRLYGHHVDVLRVHGRVIVVAGTGQAEHPAHEGVERAAVEIV